MRKPGSDHIDSSSAAEGSADGAGPAGFAGRPLLHGKVVTPVRTRKRNAYYVCTTQGRLKPAAIGGLCMVDRSPSARPSRAMPVRHRSRLPSKAGRRHAPPPPRSRRWAPMVRLLETTTAPCQMPRLGLAYSQNTHPVVQNRDVSNIKINAIATH